MSQNKDREDQAKKEKKRDKKKQEKIEALLPPEAAAFLEEVIQDSLMRYDILSFFYQNPYAILTISDLSVWISREERPLADALQQLAAMGYLSQSYASSAFVISSDREKRRRIEEFFDYLQDNPDVARQIRGYLCPPTEAC